MDRGEVEVHKLAKKRTRPISSHLDRTYLVNKGFIIWLLVKFCLRDTAGSPERARWLHLARSGSQSQRAIWFILPARKASHIIIILIDPACVVKTAGFWPRLSLFVLFSACSRSSTASRSVNTLIKNLTVTDIKRSWTHTLSISHLYRETPFLADDKSLSFKNHNHLLFSIKLVQ